VAFTTKVVMTALRMAAQIITMIQARKSETIVVDATRWCC
jgi:hypothetical protein